MKNKFGLALAFLAHLAIAAPVDNPLVYPNNLNYLGSFALDANPHGDSSAHDAEGGIAYFKTPAGTDSLFVSGNYVTPGVAQFLIPPLSTSLDINDIPVVSPVQDFYNPLGWFVGDPLSLDYVSDLLAYGNKLLFSAHRYYPASNVDLHRIGVFLNSNNLFECGIDGWYYADAHSGVEQPNDLNGDVGAGWMSELPDEWKPILGGSHLIGPADGWNVEGKNITGPSVFSFNPDNHVAGVYDTEPLVDYSFGNPINFIGNSGDNLINPSGDFWNALTNIHFGFVAQNSRTLFLIGTHYGIVDDLGYKIIQEDTGRLCGGGCPFKEADVANYYWLIDLQDVVDAQNGLRSYDSVRPYAYGKIHVPFADQVKPGNFLNLVTGGSYDPVSNRLFLQVKGGDTRPNFSIRSTVAVFDFTSSVFTPPPSLETLNLVSQNGTYDPISGIFAAQSACGGPGDTAPIDVTLNWTTVSGPGPIAPPLYVIVTFENTALTGSGSNNLRGQRFTRTFLGTDANVVVSLPPGSWKITSRVVDVNGVPSLTN